MNIGFIGTGHMGNPVAANLLTDGHDLFVHDRDGQASDNLLAAGATWCSTPAEAATDADVVFLSLPSHVEVEDVCFGTDGVLAGARPGLVLIDLTTGSVQLIPRLVQAQETHGIRYLACPVSQGVANAHTGQLSIFVGGEHEDYVECRPLLATVASVVIHTGDQFSAMASKLLTNLLWFTNAAAIAEALVLGVKSGVDLRVLRQVIVNSCGNSWVAEHDIASIYDGTFDPTFTTALCRKDLGLVAELAAMLSVPIVLGATVQDIFGSAEARYGGASPELSVVRRLQELTGVNLQTDLQTDLATSPVDTPR